MATPAAAQPALPSPVSRIRPLALGGALDEAVAIMRDRFRTIMLLLMITIVPWTYPLIVVSFDVLQDFLRGILEQDPLRLERAFRKNLFVLSPLTFVNALLLQPLAIGTVTHVTAEAMYGRNSTLKATFLKLRERLFPLLGAWFLSFMAVQVGTQMCLVPGLVANVLFLFAPQVVLAEEVGPIRALGRSFVLTKNHFITVLGLVIVLFFVRLLAPLPIFAVPEQHTMSVLLSCFGGVMLGLETAAATVLYFSCRCREEHFDLVVLVDLAAAAHDPDEPELPSDDRIEPPGAEVDLP